MENHNFSIATLTKFPWAMASTATFAPGLVAKHGPEMFPNAEPTLSGKGRGSGGGSGTPSPKSR